jgi:asparagine synthase (glutamine-hydrolysing)
MCGIAGIIQQQSRYGIEDIQKMTAALAHRGPDGEAAWQNRDASVLLGHRRLSIIDLSKAAAQPLHYLDRYTIVHNGELYNYIELREELRKEGYSFRTETDTEVIAAAYAHWNDDCLQYFDGMFAFAIWDEEEKELFAARDRFGEKPFFYFFDGTNFLFASEMKALWAAGVPKEINRQLLFNFITIGYTDNPAQPEETFYNNIYKLPPASELYFDPVDKSLYVQSYWDIDLENKRNKKISDADATAQFLALLTTSVKRRLRSDVSIGSSLSGGLDSSSVLALVKEADPSLSRMQCFTAIFPGFEKDEAAHAQMVAAKFDLAQHTLSPGPEDLLADWERLCYHQEEPFGSASIYAQYKTYQLAAEKGCTVLLDGQGADEILAGYSKYYKWYWQELFMKRKLIKSREISLAKEKGSTETFGIRNIISSLFPDLASVVLEQRYLFKALRHEDLSRDFIKQQSKEAYYSGPAYNNLGGALYFNTRMHGLEELLRYADRNAMAHGREVRLPFLNHDLVEFVFSLPSHFKIRQGWTKWLLRNAMQNKLPGSITWRKDKVGFEPPQKQWMENKKVQELVKEARKKLVNAQILRPAVLDKPVMSMSSHAADNFDWRYLATAPFL